ncbi:MAG: HTH domain-containing protein [Oscillospiraceae bacterium]|nr:HTH domain-containing protein [Oscillospiraceae bacterium]
MGALEMTLLFDYYGELLTERQRMCIDLRHNQDLSLAEIAQELNVSRQGVHDNLTRAEALLRNMEEKTECVRRDLASRKAIARILEIAKELETNKDTYVSDLAGQIIAVAEGVEE